MMLVLTVSCVLCNAGSSGSSNTATDINNSFNPYPPSTSGSILTSSSSTAQSMLETYLQTFPINEQQNVLTTVFQSRHHATNTVDVDKEKMTTSLSELAFTTSNTAIAGGGSAFASTESSQTSSVQNQNFPETPVVIATGSSLPAILSTSTNLQDLEHPAVVSHELLGCGPNHREGIGIQKALDWLRDKRSSDYGWDNDTHMVILAREVS